MKYDAHLAFKDGEHIVVIKAGAKVVAEFSAAEFFATPAVQWMIELHENEKTKQPA